MSQTYISSYTKPDVTFANGFQAYLDKNSLYGPELTESVESCYNNMQTAGILLEPVTPVWDQENHILNVVKKVTSVEAYQAALTFDEETAARRSYDAGWTYLGNREE